MKAGIVEFDLKTKDININPQNATTDIELSQINGTIKKFRIKSFKEENTLLELQKISMFYNEDKF